MVVVKVFQGFGEDRVDIAVVDTVVVLLVVVEAVDTAAGVAGGCLRWKGSDAVAGMWETVAVAVAMTAPVVGVAVDRAGSIAVVVYLGTAAGRFDIENVVLVADTVGSIVVAADYIVDVVVL